ncbi:helix-turn-helix domain-containing protein [Nocardia asiatica]|uniref:helix-turn-helix domain-containing protein n=1 Tax=Nocardia asiatica TaxID=209252 RepID=UPI002458FFD7|nr:helix-turn-helix transcriptional regulator [Nocardia asiatica]
MDDAGIGERTARARKLVRLTQLQLAHKANVSVSLLRKVERGARPASPAFIAAVASALGVDIEDLTGQPYTFARDDAGAHATIRELRRKIMAFNDEPLIEPSTLEELSAALRRVQESRRRGRYGDTTAELPDVIHGLHALANDEPSGHRLETIYSTLAYAYNSASSVAYRYGYLDLAGLAAERCVWAAERSGDPAWPIAAEYHRALILLYSGAYAGGLRIIERARAASEQLSTTSEVLAVRGALHLRGSICRRVHSTRTPPTRICGKRAGSVRRSAPTGTRSTGPGSICRTWRSTPSRCPSSCPTARQRSHAPSAFGYRHRSRRRVPGITGSTCPAHGCCTATSSVLSAASTKPAGSHRA